MTAVIRISLTPQSEAVIRRHGGRARILLEKIDRALGQTAAEAESLLKIKYLRGGDVKSPRRGRGPLAVRSGSLLQTAASGRESATSHFFGMGEGSGPASRYARTVAGEGTTTITPKKSKHLWIPVGDNLTASGQMRLSPSAAFEARGPRGGRLLSIFTSRAGNLVAVLRSAAGKAKGKSGGGKLLFVLKKSVTVQGTGAVARATEDIRPRGLELLGIAIRSLDNSGGGGAA